MDVLRFEQELAALSPDHQITPLAVAGISPDFQQWIHRHVDGGHRTKARRCQR